MAYLNDQWFENAVPLRRADILASGETDASICAESGYEADLLFARHCPPDGTYWLGLNHYTRSQTAQYGPRPSWQLVQVGQGVGALRQMRWLWGGDVHFSWYDFSQAHWVGPVDMPTPPSAPPGSWAQRM